MKNKTYEEYMKENYNRKIDEVNKQFEQGLIDDEEHLFKIEQINRRKIESDFVKKLDDVYFSIYKLHFTSFFLCDILEKIQEEISLAFEDEKNRCRLLNKINRIFDDVFDIWTNEEDLKIVGFRR